MWKLVLETFLVKIHNHSRTCAASSCFPSDVVERCGLDVLLLNSQGLPPKSCSASGGKRTTLSRNATPTFSARSRALRPNNRSSRVHEKLLYSRAIDIAVFPGRAWNLIKATTYLERAAEQLDSWGEGGHAKRGL